MSEIPNTNGDIRNEKGQFVKGSIPNPNGRPKERWEKFTNRKAKKIK
jgi:hypothetical protein